VTALCYLALHLDKDQHRGAEMLEVGDLQEVYSGIKSAIEPYPVRQHSFSTRLDYNLIYSQQEHFTRDVLSHLLQLA